ncbi:peptidyl-prolyl cis-trans isomerase FKBP2-like isoform X2 [Pectinophora gossypiella]|nr:peptidyl-prolyl cis-trans isomerase FKBP2-like isoform X2 [Pectinophora gossypiella]XP_049886079.1 peptidyl-prolyl cis-trans isomerase FKBP2-like isoform X2 [Pectinophora gossypiella]
MYLAFTAFLEDGTEFDSSLRRREPIVITLGRPLAIEGWNHGLQGMCVGEKRKLIIPPHLALGEEGSPPDIPPHATLIFHFTLVKIYDVEEDEYVEGDDSEGKEL